MASGDMGRYRDSRKVWGIFSRVLWVVRFGKFGFRGRSREFERRAL